MTDSKKRLPDKAEICRFYLTCTWIVILLLSAPDFLSAQAKRSIGHIPSIELGTDALDLFSNQRHNFFLQSRLIPQLSISAEWGFSGYSLSDGFIHRVEDNAVFSMGLRFFPFVNRPDYKPIRGATGNRLSSIDPRTHEPCSLKSLMKGFYMGLVFRSESVLQSTDLVEAIPLHFDRIDAQFTEHSIGISIGYQFLLNRSPRKAAWNRSRSTLFTFFLMPEFNLMLAVPASYSDPAETLAYKHPDYTSYPFEHRFLPVFQLRAGLYFQQVRNR